MESQLQCLKCLLGFLDTHLNLQLSAALKRLDLAPHAFYQGIEAVSFGSVLAQCLPAQLSLP